MVIFCHAIATANISDLACLGSFVASLQSSGETVEAAEKLRRLCQVFHRVAELYIQTKLANQPQQFQQFQFEGAGNINPQTQLNSSLQYQKHQHQQNMSARPSTSTTPRTNSQRNISMDSESHGFRQLESTSLTQQPSFNPSNSSTNFINDFEPYLSALGFPNAAGFLNIGQQHSQQPQQQQSGPASQVTGPAEYTTANLEAGLDANSLENWFTGNVNLMSLLETDLSSIIK